MNIVFVNVILKESALLKSFLQVIVVIKRYSSSKGEEERIGWDLLLEVFVVGLQICFLINVQVKDECGHKTSEIEIIEMIDVV